MRKAPNFRIIFRNILGALASKSGYQAFVYFSALHTEE